jgi:hypothetical protein
MKPASVQEHAVIAQVLHNLKLLRNRPPQAQAEGRQALDAAYASASTTLHAAARALNTVLACMIASCPGCAAGPPEHLTATCRQHLHPACMTSMLPAWPSPSHGAHTQPAMQSALTCAS